MGYASSRRRALASLLGIRETRFREHLRLLKKLSEQIRLIAVFFSLSDIDLLAKCNSHVFSFGGRGDRSDTQAPSLQKILEEP